MALFVAGPVRPVAEYNDGNRVEGGQSRTPEGVLLWSVDLASFVDGQLAVMKTKFPSPVEPTGLEIQAIVKVSDFIARPYIANGSSQVAMSFSASAVAVAVKQG